MGPVELPSLPWHVELPPLPAIDNKAIRNQVFTHTSVHAAHGRVVDFADTDHEQLDNEKLEWVGDGLLSESRRRRGSGAKV